jgi:hypothetical protein
MYKDLKTRYWWYGMKRDVMEYVALCITCQRVKGRTPETNWITAISEDPRMKMGRNKNGFHSWVTSYSGWI